MRPNKLPHCDQKLTLIPFVMILSQYMYIVKSESLQMISKSIFNPNVRVCLDP